MPKQKDSINARLLGVEKEEQSGPFKRLRVFGLTNIKSLGKQVAGDIKEKTKRIFSGALNWFRGDGDESNERRVDGGGENVYDLDSDAPDNGMEDNGMERSERNEKKIAEFEVYGLNDLYNKLKEIYFQANEGRRRRGEKLKDKESIKIMILRQIVNFERGVVKKCTQVYGMSEEDGLKFVGRRFFLAGQAINAPTFKLVLTTGSDGKRRVKLISDNFLTFMPGPKKKREEVDTIINEIVSDGGLTVERDIGKTSSRRDKRRKREDGREWKENKKEVSIPSLLPTALSEVLREAGSELKGQVNFYNDYHEVFEMPVEKIVKILDKLKQKGEFTQEDQEKINKVLHLLIGENSKRDTLDDYLNKYLWGEEVTRIYQEIKEKFLDEEKDIDSMPAKQLMNKVVAEADIFSNQFIADLFKLMPKIKESPPGNNETLKVYFTRLLQGKINNNKEQRKKFEMRSKVVVDFVQRVAPILHKFILLNEFKHLRNGNRKSRESRDGVNDNQGIPYYDRIVPE